MEHCRSLCHFLLFTRVILCLLSLFTFSLSAPFPLLQISVFILVFPRITIIDSTLIDKIIKFLWLHFPLNSNWMGSKRERENKLFSTINECTDSMKAIRNLHDKIEKSFWVSRQHPPLSDYIRLTTTLQIGNPHNANAPSRRPLTFKIIPHTQLQQLPHTLSTTPQMATAKKKILNWF